MPGLALTNEFMLGTATVMLGPVDSLFDLNPASHSIGLVKNCGITCDPTYTELTQGTQGTVVYSVLTSNIVRVTMEAYEHTTKNLMYALGLQGAELATKNTVSTTVSVAVAGSGTTDMTLSVTSATGLSAGDYIMILVDSLDNFVVRKIVSIASNVLTLDKDLPDIPLGSVVRKVSMISVGSKTAQQYWSAKIAGQAANGEPVVILLPKIRITKGFNVIFNGTDYTNLPLEFTSYDLVPTDVNYSAFNGDQVKMFRR